MMGQLTELELPFHVLFAGGSKSSTAGTFVPVLGSESSREQKFQERKFHTWNFRSWEGMVLGAKSPVTVNF